MPTIWIREFTGGLDVRRLHETAPGGTMMRGTDCHVTRGGEIEQRADFVPVYTLEAERTKSLAATPLGLVVFGHLDAPTLPDGVTYQRLQHPGGVALTRVPYHALYRSKIMAVGEFADGNRYLFYDGNLVGDVKAPPVVDGSLPKALLTHTEKMYVGSGQTLFFSAVGDSTDYGSSAGVGDGFIVMSTHADGSEDITGLGRYDEYIAVFSRRTIQTWFVDPDPTLNRQAQVLNGTGCVAPRSVTQFGDGDLFYLDLSGIRSLRARDSSNSAATTDIGSPIDPILLELRETLGEATLAKAVGVIEPRDGRFWMAIDNRIYVFSFFSASKVSAWSEYRPGFVVEDMLTWNDKVWLRSGDTIYCYGGTGVAQQYSADVQAEVWIPYLDAGEPFREKHVDGIDLAVRGAWSVALATDPNNLDAEDAVARVDRTTYGELRIPATGSGTHLSLRFRSLAPAEDTKPAVLGSAVIHFDGDGEEDS